MNYFLKLKALQVVENRRIYLKVYSIYLTEKHEKSGYETISIPAETLKFRRKSSFVLHVPNLDDSEGKLLRLRKLSGNSQIISDAEKLSGS